MLTNPACVNATCPEGKARARLADAGGLYLEVSPAGSKRWFVKYRHAGKERRLALGSYPDVSLKAARDARDEARKVRQTGTDPVLAKRAARLAKQASAATTFEGVAREFHATKCSGWSESHSSQWLRACEKDLFPWMGTLPLADITAPMLHETLKRVEARGALYMARDLCEFAGQVFRFGIATGRCERNPAADLRGALKPRVEKHAAAILQPQKVGELMRAITGYSGQPTTRAALLLSALTFQRPGNIRAMEWAEVDTEAALWTIPAAKMKRTKTGKLNGRPHQVPLAPQAVAVLNELRPLTGNRAHVFPSLRGEGRCMSENTIRGALRGLGYGNDDMTAHGFRAMARTLIVEQLPGIDPAVVEAQLAHGKSGALGMAYDRAEYMALRRELMVKWADYLDRLRDGADVIPLQSKRA